MCKKTYAGLYYYDTSLDLFIIHTWSPLLSHSTFTEAYGVMLLEVIYQTQETVFDHIFKHQEESRNYDMERSIFDGLQGA